MRSSQVVPSASELHISGHGWDTVPRLPLLVSMKKGRLSSDGRGQGPLGDRGLGALLMSPKRIARGTVVPMTKQKAEQERVQLAKSHPESTWLIAESDSGDWSVIRVGLEPTAAAEGTTVESHSQPNPAEDPRSALRKNVGPEHV